MSKKKNPFTPTEHNPPADGLWFLPLGGTGEIGMNLSLYGTAGKWLMVDCGVSFGDETTPGVDQLMPDISFIEARRDHLVGLVITHAHEDHIGAIEHLWPKLQCPIYATRFSAGLIRAKLAEHDLNTKVRIIELPLDGQFSLGPFQVQLVHVTHSIPESNMLAITTPAGRVLHTGDYKFDPEPMIGAPTNFAALKAFGELGVMALVGDSTNATVPGHTGSEKQVVEHFTELFGRLRRRIVVTCFSSNIVRLRSAYHAARANGREFGLVGRSMWRNAEIAFECGYLPEFKRFLSDSEAAYVPAEKLVLACTGSQGEIKSALARIASGDHPEIELEAGDTVIFSSRDIPGNEKSIAKVQNGLLDQNIHVLTVENEVGVHVSGHAARDEIAELYQLVRPQLAVPVHGETRHQMAHVEIARSCQVNNHIIPSNGQIIHLGPGQARVVATIPAGVWGMDGKTLRPLNVGAVKERKKLSYNGVAIATIVVGQSGQMMSHPQVTLLGLTDRESKEDATWRNDAADEIADTLAQLPKSARTDDNAIKNAAGQALRRLLNSAFAKRPQLEIHVVRV